MTAAQLVSSQEPGWRARYTLAAARRLAAGMENGDYSAALARERAYRAAHIAAGKNRRAAARKLDVLGREHDGELLIWRTRRDDRVSLDCQLLDGRVFPADSPPDGQIPGAVHPRCRCYAVPYRPGWNERDPT
jgi:SPP1 gp7 family putative phage head morphogenesis protein